MSWDFVPFASKAGSGDGSSDLGWEFVLDTQYPSAANGLDVDANTWVRIPNNGFVLPQGTNLPEGVTGFFNAADNKLEFDSLNSWYGVTLAFGIVPAVSGASFNIRGLIDSNPVGNFFGPTVESLAVDAGVENPQFITTEFPVTQSILDNGVYYEINCTADCTIYLSAYLISKKIQK